MSFCPPALHQRETLRGGSPGGSGRSVLPFPTFVCLYERMKGGQALATVSQMAINFQQPCRTWLYPCAESDDGYHHANSYQIDYHDGYYHCICTYCGHEFDAYESDLKQSYNDYVGTLPATGYNSSGNLIWQPTHSDISALKYYFSPGGSFVSSWLVDLPSNISSSELSNGYSFSFVPNNVQSKAGYYFFGCVISKFPVSGTYSLYEYSLTSFRGVRSSNSQVDTKSGKSSGISTFHYPTEKSVHYLALLSILSIHFQPQPSRPPCPS